VDPEKFAIETIDSL